MLNLKNRIINLARMLLPTGRAWRMGNLFNMTRLFKALSVKEAQAVDNSTAIFNSIIPDNPNFTADDATDWEVRLGMITNADVSLEIRKAAILRKMAAPGINPAKSNYLWMQKQLQDAGFNVWVHENLFFVYPNGFVSVAPNTLYGNSNLSVSRHGQFQHGQRRHGLYYNNLIVNSLSQAKDNTFNIGGTFESTFFIGGEILGTYADVPAIREIEFRQLILNQKQVQNVGFLFVHYV